MSVEMAKEKCRVRNKKKIYETTEDHLFPKTVRRSAFDKMKLVSKAKENQNRSVNMRP
jgi:uncharacterized protein (UPF0147 family)